MSDEQGERFYKDIIMDQNIWNTYIMIEYGWNLMRNCTKNIYSRKPIAVLESEYKVYSKSGLKFLALN